MSSLEVGAGTPLLLVASRSKVQGSGNKWWGKRQSASLSQWIESDFFHAQQWRRPTNPSA